MIRRLIFGWLGIHTCRECNEQLDTITIDCQRGIVYGVVQDTVQTSKCMCRGQLVDFTAMRRCPSYTKGPKW